MAAQSMSTRSVQNSGIPWMQILAWTVLIVTTFISLWPMYWLFVTAITPTQQTIKTPPDLFPVNASLENFVRLFSQARDYWRWFANSLIIGLTVTLFHIFFDTLAGYAFAKKRFPGRNILFWIILSTLMIPAHVTLVPMYIVTRNLGLIDNILAVILPATASVFGIFLMRQYIQTLPSELEDAARIDGCSEPGVFWRVILPLSKPAIGALAIFTFVRHWNDFLWPLIVLQKSQNYTLPVGVASLQDEFSTDYGIIFAGAALAALPMIVFFLAFQRYFLEGVRMGAVKG
ncbi:MAG: carbohydrate ABC transporter permease [Chloroflexi bacterium AL-W]|nr:carbohydrate ABC transporter permease [Chloroflexi bacterium AL-N1]NOK66059.1 carbohydrate ABC transporter permease [Chloroflexi bacterium AL-N10]NOK72940.1 carbohydrate ABC transporter permease [Chloroflexi bacterium AL-N5]NOK79837.1 carbohydrate ABC transporter permease [Chloroflexi bacterium AL-W]NOK88307.1 carbohydrate ABC transporter permease [Chloroflexi bacterium AL-N15]